LRIIVKEFDLLIVDIKKNRKLWNNSLWYIIIMSIS